MSKKMIADKKALELETSNLLNAALAKGKLKTAYALLQIKNSIRQDLGHPPFTLPYLESKFKK